MKYSEVEKLCATHGKDIKAFDKFMYGQTVGLADGEIDYYEGDVERFIGVPLVARKPTPRRKASRRRVSPDKFPI